ncbi:MAG: pilus assembly protein [Eubacteriales bacterium]|nr:pilus assembly protein [Eubacteriales bacterium]
MSAFPAGRDPVLYEKRIFLRILRGSLTLETACVLPFFLLVMISVLQFARIGTASSAILAGMQDAAKDMAAYAYIRELGVTPGDAVAGDLIAGGLSAAYAKSRVDRQPGYRKADGIFSLLQTSFHDEIIDLAGTYQMRHALSALPSLRIKSVLRARVRAWTGRIGSGGNGSDEGEQQEKEEMVYMAKTGTVYHKDPDCTHIRLSIQKMDRAKVNAARNISGGKYHACERCKTSGASTVYVTVYGDKYHGSIGCSGLKRTVSRVPLSEAKGLRPCSKCGGG